MENNFKRFLSLLLAFVMVFGMFPANVFATGEESAHEAASTVVEVATLAELQAALADTSNELPIKITATIVIGADENVTIDLNGKTVIGDMHKSVGPVIKNEGTLTLQNGTVTSAGNNGGSALLNSGNATVNGVTLNGAPNADGSWPSYTVNNTGELEVNDSKITSYHGAVASYNEGALVTLNSTDIDMAGIPGFTNHAIYTYNNGAAIVNSGNIANNAADQNSTGGSVINGAVTVNGGTFNGRVESYYGTPVVKGGTFKYGDAVVNVKKYVPAGYTYDPQTGEVEKDPAKGSVTIAFTGETGFWGEGGGNATESLVVSVYEGDKVIGTASLNNIGGIIDGDVYVTWNIPFAGSNDEYWTVKWAEGYPNVNMAPTKVTMTIDGVVVAENDHQWNAADSLFPIVALAENDGKVGAYQSVSAAVAAGAKTVALVRDTNEQIMLPQGVTLNTNGHKAEGVVLPAAMIGTQGYKTLNEAFAAAVEGDTIVLLADATPALTSQRAITKAAVIDLNGKTLTLNKGDLYFGTTTFQNGKIVVDPSVNASTAVFWMFEGQNLTFNDVEIVATGVTGTYLIGINGGSNTAVKLIDSKITIENTEKAGLTAVICDNGDGNEVVIENCDIDVSNIEGRFYLGGTNGTVTVKDSDVELDGVKEGFYIRAGQTLSIKGDSNVAITLNDTNGRYGINVTAASATYEKAETATVTATVYEISFAKNEATKTATIKNLDGLKQFRDEVNDGNTFAGWTVVLAANIDLANEEWAPIGYMGNTFKGTFDGGNFTISNLKITKELTNAAANNGIGFFGRTDDTAVIKNLTIENVEITGSLYVGAVVGLGYTGKSIENVTVKGDIKIDAWWYAGVIGGNGYMNLINDCHVIGNEGSYIKGNEGSYIGGIWGFRGEGNNKITNCSVKGLEILGVDRVGGICGIGHYGNTISGCAAEDVTITADDPNATTVGLIVGACEGTASEPTKFENNTLTNTTAQIANGDGTYTKVENEYGSNIKGGEAVTNCAAKIGNKTYLTLAAAVAAAKAGDEIVLLKNVSEEIQIPDGAKLTLNLNGKTLNGYIKPFKGNLTVENGSIVNTNKSVSGIEITAGELVLNNVNITSARHAVRVEGAATVTIDGGVYKVAPTAKGTYHAVNVGGAGGEKVIIKDGTFIGPKGTMADSGAAVSIRANAEVTIEGGNFSGGKLKTLGNAGKLTVKGGTFDQNPVAYIPEGYVSEKQEDGSYKVRELKDLVIHVGPVTTRAIVDVSVATMDEAVAYALANPADSVTYKISGPVELTTGGTHGILNLGKNVTIEGVTPDAMLTIVGGGVPDIKGVTFKNITLADEGTYNSHANEFMYQNYIDCSFENVTFVDGIRLSGKSTLTGCTVNVNTTNEYAIWLDKGEFTMTGSKVIGGNDAYGLIKSDEVDKITITGNTFEYLGNANKEALNVKGATIKAENNTFIDCVKGILPADKTNYAEDGAVLTESAVIGDNKVITNVAEVNGKKFETLEAAYAAAQNGDEVKILKAGSYKLPTGKNITITGKVNGVVFENIGAHNMGGASVTFNNVTFNYANDSMYKGLQHCGDMKYTDCTFNGTVFLYGQSEIFTNCTFNQDTGNYNVWTYGAKEVDFINCTFNSAGKSVLVYTEAANHFIDLDVTGSTFNASAAVDGKAAIEIDTSLTAGANITIDDATTANGFGNGNVSGNSLWNNKKGSNTDANNDITVKVGNETVLAPVTFVAYIGKNGYTTIAAAYAAANEGETVELLAPIVVAAGETLELNKAVTVTYTSNVPGEDMITNRGNLVIDGTTLVYTNTDTTASNVTVSTISCEPGSNLEVKSGTVKNDSANNASKGIYAYAIDILTNGSLGDVTATISGGEIISTNYMAIRQFNNGTACKNTLTVTGGKIYGEKRAIQIHLNNDAAYTTISGGTVEAGEGGYALCFFPTNATHIAVTGGTFTGTVYSATNGFISGGTYSEELYEGYCAEGYAPKDNGNGTYTVVEQTTVTITVGNATMVAGNSLPEFTYISDVEIDGLAVEFSTAADGKTAGEFAINATVTAPTDSKYVYEIVPGKLTVEAAKVRVYQKTDSRVVFFTDLAEAVAFAAAQKWHVPVYLLGNITIDKPIVITDSNAGMVELQGDVTGARTYTLSSTHAGEMFKVEKGATLAVKNLKVNAQGDAFYVNGGVVNLNCHSLGKQFLEVTSQTGNCVYIRGGSANVNGAKLTSLGAYPAIQGNGSYVGDVTINTWNIGDKPAPEISAPNAGIAIYWPQNGKLTVEAGTITGKTALYAKSGTIVINGGEFVATGDKVDFKHYSNGAYATGDAVVIEACKDAAYETPNVTINGGIFKSANAEAVKFYACDTAAAAADVMDITAGSFSTAVPEDYCADGYIPTNKLADGTYSVKQGKFVARVNDVGFETIAEAIAAANNGEIVVMISETDETEVVIDKAIELDSCGIKLPATVTLADLGATVKASENQNVVSGVKDYKVKYDNGTYSLVKAVIAKIGNVGYSTLAEAVAAAQPGQTIKLVCDAEGAGVVIDKNLTIDFAGYTYTLTEGVGSTGTESNGFQILKGNTVRIQGGTLNVAESAKDEFYILIQNYANLTVYNMTLDGTNLDKYSGTDGDSYTLSNNCGSVAINKSTVKANDEGELAFAFDVCDKTAWGYTLPIVTVYPSAVIEGKIEAAAKVGNSYYATLAHTVENAVAGKTITLQGNISGAGVVIDKDTIIDFNGYTYTLTEGVGSTGTESNGFQILKGNKVTLKNGTLKVADSAADKFYILIQNYANLTVNNMTLDGTNLDKWSKTDGDSYTLSNNSGKVTIGAGTKIIANNDGSKAFAFDACDKSAWGYELPVVTVNKTAVINGNIEAAAKIGNVYYATLNQAIEAASNKQTITLVSDINLNNVKPVLLDGSYNTYFKVEGKTLTIDLNGKTISGAHTDTSNMLVGVFSTENDGHLTLTGNGTVNLTEGEGATVYSLMSNYDDDCTITIENGTYTLNSAKDCLLHSSCDKGLIIKGGNFTLGNVAKGHWTGNRGNGSPWIINVNGQNDGAAVVSGGTYNFNIAEQHWVYEVSIEDGKGNLGVIVNNGDGTWTVNGKTAEVAIVQAVNGSYIGYATFKDAVASIGKGAPETTIVLLKDINVKGQFIGHSYAQKVVIDLNGYKMSSADKTLTVFRGGTEVTIKNGTVHGNSTGGTLQATYGGKLTLGENVTITCGGSANAIKVDANSTLIVADETVKVLGGKADLVVAEGANIQISAGYFKHPVNADWCAEGYIPTEKLPNGYYSVEKDPSIGKAAKIGNAYYVTLQEAIEAAKDGDKIIVLTDIAVSSTEAVTNNGGYAVLYNIAEKAITIDLNGKKIEATVNAADVADDKSGILLGVFCVDNNGTLTLTGKGTVTANAVDADMESDDSHLYSLMVAYGAGSKLFVENGTYHANSVNSALVYSQYDEVVTINGGTYTLGNLGTDTNGSPWLFNAKGQNTQNILVNGGTFAADIVHQYYPFEVQMPKELALSKGEDGMYTVVPAVAYVNEQEWSSKWYTNYVGYATVKEAEDAAEGIKTKVVGKNTYYSDCEVVTLLVKEEVNLEDVLGGEIANVDLPKGEYTLPATSGEVSISGSKDTVITVNDVTANQISLSGVTVKSSGKAYTGIKHSEEVVFTDCTIVGNMYLYAEEVVFTNCTFDLSATNDYIWVYGAKNVTFKDCTFNTMGKAILVFQDGSKLDQTVTVEGCTFNASQSAHTWNGIHVAAVSMDGGQGGTYNVVLNNNTVDNNFNGLWQDKTGAGNITVTVNGTTVLTNN